MKKIFLNLFIFLNSILIGASNIYANSISHIKINPSTGGSYVKQVLLILTLIILLILSVTFFIIKKRNKDNKND